MSLAVLFYPLGGSNIVVEGTPPDDDADTVVTAYLDRDGATIRPPRLTVLTACDSLLNSDLEQPDRLPMDTHEAKSDRVGRGTTEGLYFRVFAFTKRAGEPLGIRSIDVDVDYPPLDPGRMNPGTDTGTDRDGASMETASVSVFMAADSLRNADLDPASGAVQDSHLASYQAPNTNMVGTAHRITWMTAGRAGALACPALAEVEYDLAGPELIRAKVV